MAKSTHSLEKRLAAYAAAAGVAVAVSPIADAQVVYVDLDPDVCSAFGSNPTIDFDGDATADVTVVHNTYAAYGLYGDLNFAYGSFVAASTSGNYAAALSSGATISSAQIFGNGLFSALFGTGYGVGEWLGGLTAFVGFQFTADVGGGNTNHFGWMRVAVPPTHDEVCVDDYAFESTPGAPIDAATVPVELTSFDAQVSGDDVVLSWETASETNNAGFEVQLKQGNDWQVLGFVEGNGTTTEAQTYSYRAEDMDVGTHTFRLKQIDYDG
ncbi:MAG: hypothetical protein R3284_10040, partial [Rubricoccaceae bacterium]|nr:hypothetical protein [Rubricoccaceae bacterium]